MLVVVNMVLIGKLLLRDLVVVRIFGVMFKFMYVYKCFVWLMFDCILLKMSNVLCLLYSVCMFLMKLVLGNIMFFLFCRGFIIMV